MIDDDLFDESSSTEDETVFVGNHRVDGGFCEQCGYSHEDFSKIKGFMEAIKRMNQKSPHALDTFLAALQNQLDTVPTILAAHASRSAEAGMIAGSQHGSFKAMRAILTKLAGEEEVKNAERFFEVEARLLYLHFVHLTQTSNAADLEVAEKDHGNQVLEQLVVLDAVRKKIVERNIELLTEEYRKLSEEYGYPIDPKIIEAGLSSDNNDGLGQLLPLLYAMNHP